MPPAFINVRIECQQCRLLLRVERRRYCDDQAWRRRLNEEIKRRSIC